MPELTLKEMQVELKAAQERKDIKAVEILVQAIREYTTAVSAMREVGLFDIESPWKVNQE